MTNNIINLYIKKIINLKYTLASIEKIKKIINILNIDMKTKIITIGGTNGKGSTVKILEYIFTKNNINYISHISPHILKFNERIKYNNKMISNNTLKNQIITIIPILHKLKTTLNYYQISFLCLCLYTKQKNPEWLILEIGLGGRLDPANIFDSEIAILTNISIDHSHILGKNINIIGIEKAHIARTKKPIILGSKMPPSVNQYLKDIKAIIINNTLSKKYNKYKNANIHFTSIACALQTMPYISKFTKIPKELSKIKYQGRIQVLQNNPKIIIDVSHNIASVKYLFQKIRIYKKKYRYFIAIFNIQKSKDFNTIIKIAKKYINEWIIIDLPKYHKIFLKNNELKIILPKCKIYNCMQSIIKYLKNTIKKNSLIIIFGSFIVIKEWIKIYEKKIPHIKCKKNN